MTMYKIKIEILSPVHISDGTELEPLEYVIKNNKLYRIDLSNFLSNLPLHDQNNFMSFTSTNNLVEIRKFIKDRFDIEKSPYFWSVKLTGTVSRLYEEKFKDIQNQLKMSPFIRTSDKPYIPGSSLKGSLRTALLNLWSEGINVNDLDRTDRQYDKLVEGKILNAIKERDRKQFDIDKDPFKALLVSDSFLPDNSTFFAKLSNFNLKDGILNETQMQIIREITNFAVAGHEILFDTEITVKEEILKKNNLKSFTLETILKASDTFYKKILESEKSRLFEMKKDTYELYDKIFEKAKGGYLCRIGFGCGFESITIEKFRFLKQPEKGKPGMGWGYSKYLAEGKHPLGFIKLSL